MNTTWFVQNIIKMCNKRGVKPTVACRESGAGSNLLQNLKNGSEPSIGKVLALAQYLDCTVSELLGEVAELPPSEELPLRDCASILHATDVQRLTVAEVELVLAYRQATPKERALVDMTLADYKKGTNAIVG